MDGLEQKLMTFEQFAHQCMWQHLLGLIHLSPLQLQEVVLYLVQQEPIIQALGKVVVLAACLVVLELQIPALANHNAQVAVVAAHMQQALG
jgi:hypothetical protein